ncbi:MAG TPA: undecaprenyl-diphosphate phosphatase [bacterium]|nr:undecaprenyl-diphosphate phosphatase [bacterium]
MAPIHYFILAIIQSATEFLPVSSSGHLLFYKTILRHPELPVIFDIIVHVGSLLAIAVYFHKRIMALVIGGLQELAEPKRTKENLRLWVYILISTGVTLTFYLFLKPVIELRYHEPRVLPLTFAFTGVVLILTRKTQPAKQLTDRGILLPIAIGFFQGLAIMPGISRSGATIAMALFMGVKREEAGFYSFVLAIPAILGALVFKMTDIESLHFIRERAGWMAGAFLLSAAGSYLFLSLLTRVLKRGRFWRFGFYALAMSLVSFFVIITINVS